MFKKLGKGLQIALAGVGGVFLILGVVAILSVDSDTPEATEVTDVAVQMPENVRRIENTEQKITAINKVRETFAPDMTEERTAPLITFTDVYENPNGEGLIVWMSDDRNPSGGFVYLVLGEEVFAITGNATVFSPEIAEANNLVFEDLEDIGRWRIIDTPMRLEACLKLADILRGNGAVPKMIIDKQRECHASYPNA